MNETLERAITELLVLRGDSDGRMTATVRCPGCNQVFVRAQGVLDPPKAMPSVPLECVCKNRKCRRTFTVRIGVTL